MPEIKVLDQSTINKIAAGEVIERPSSVVKELVENALDAGANAVTVEIKDGGTSLIRITDNGSGIEKNQIQLAFLRHSTSKIRSVEDLLTISSLGFRGEALSSITAVSQVELITKTKPSLTGVRYLIDGGKEKSIEDIGAPDGTTFIVRNLFYNTPARRKFLKSATTEGGYIGDLLERLALSHPEVSFRLISQGSNKLYTSGNGQLKDVIYGIFGREVTANIMPLEYKGEKFSVSGFIGKPSMVRGNRIHENYFINGRYIKSGVISKAIEDAYSGFCMPKKYPFTCLNFTINPEIIDVNVHPTKMELRFSDSEGIGKEIYQCILDCLSHRNVIPEVVTSEHKISNYTPKPQITGQINSQINNQSNKPVTKVVENRIPEPFEKARTSSLFVFDKPNPYKTSAPIAEKAQVATPPVNNNVNDKEIIKAKLPEKVFVEPEVSKAPVQLSFADTEKKLLDEKSVPEHKIIGQLFDTYWLVEFDQKAYLIDQHAAHEKVLYEKYMKRMHEGSIASQQLMPPEIITLNLASGQVLKDNLDYFHSMGFEIESFGGNEYTVRAVPLELYGSSGKDMVLEIIDDLMQNSRGKDLETIKDRIATMACKAAVKGNNKLNFSEIKTLINDLLSLENPYNCPHGRPTMISMSKYEIEKKFKRIV